MFLLFIFLPVIPEVRKSLVYEGQPSSAVRLTVCPQRKLQAVDMQVSCL